jgi:DNA-binding NtrC family response regulator
MREGSFREDLFFRLNVIRIHLPPLRERPDDLLALAHHYLRCFARETGRPVRGFTDEALARIRSHAWPGNVRELHNTLQRGVLLAEGPRIDAEDLALPSAGDGERGVSWRPDLPQGGMPLRELEREFVLEALRRSRFMQKDAAKLLGISRRKLNYMIRRMGITHAGWRRNRPPEPAAAGGGRPGTRRSRAAP